MVPPPQEPHISVVVGIVVGLLASFVQSLGLTLQRSSHLANEALPPAYRKPDRKRPLWLVGFVIFLVSNLGGTIFQIGALPLTLLGALGGVSLLWNAFFARVILGDEFTVHLAAGIVFIAGGAVLIGMFGVVPEVTHTLDELVALYRRPAFLVWISLLCLALLVIVVFAHLAEWALERRIARLYPSAPPLTPRPSWRRHRRRWSAPPCPSLDNQSQTQSSPALLQRTTDTKYGATGERRPSATATNVATTAPSLVSRTSGRGPAGHGEHIIEVRGGKTLPVLSVNVELKEESQAASEAAIERSRLVLGVAYGAVSGTLSGLCLLFAKTGVELLILTITGQNQFGRVEAWIIVLTLLVAAVAQLFYLNRALRLVGPTLICPLAFCFYSITSIVSGLIYYDQWDQLSRLQGGLVALGTAILLLGVWTVSMKGETKSECEPIAMNGEQQHHTAFVDEPEHVGDDDRSDSDDSDVEPIEWIPRGLTIGIGAASPGFDIRPAPSRRQTRTATLPAVAAFPSPLQPPENERSPLVDRSFGRFPHPTDLEAGPSEASTTTPPSHRRHSDRQRGHSISGALYVGRRSESDSAPNSPTVEGGSEHGLGLGLDENGQLAGPPPGSPRRRGLGLTSWQRLKSTLGGPRTEN